MNKTLLTLKVFRQLGWRQGFLYAWYQFLQRSGILRLLTPTRNPSPQFQSTPLPLKFIPPKINIHPNNKEALLYEANQILKGSIKLFGRLTHKLDFNHPEEMMHWTKHRSTWVNGQDIKIYWEMARFSWTTVLARAYAINKDEKYAQAYWGYLEDFLDKNPVNQGIHWVSAQEVALRLISLGFCYSIFENSSHSTSTRKSLFLQTIIDHASRIIPTFSYSRAQNNNHLITEAIGLYTAAALLPTHPKAKKWRSLGWKWFNRAIQSQIMADGSYIQNSTNYHRLLLHSAIWAKKIAEIHEDDFPLETKERIASATTYLYGFLDQESGQVPNLGPNDGANILPFTSFPYNDYRPVLQAAGRAFLEHSLFPPGKWDEFSDWMGLDPLPMNEQQENNNPYRIDSKNTWASIRTVKHHHRPGHADQLHVELWWQGLNVAQDAGSYLYNSPPPWQNVLSGTDVHNTVQINNQDQMTKASRFLYLDWAQATMIENRPGKIIAEQDGYINQGITHRRSLELVDQDQWIVEDNLTNHYKKDFVAQLHWFLPDWPWQIEQNTILLESPEGPIRLMIESKTPFEVSLVRAGALLHGNAEFPPHRGWVSPTYAVKNPALSLAIRTNSQSQVNLISTWYFPKK